MATVGVKGLGESKKADNLLQCWRVWRQSVYITVTSLWAVSLTTQRTQRNELLHGKCRHNAQNGDIQSCCILDKRYFFIRATKEANSICSIYEQDHESFHHFQSCQVWLYWSAR